MSVALREKLKKAKKNSELKRIKEIIASKVDVEIDKILDSDVSYHDIINVSYDKIKINNGVYSVSSEVLVFFDFIMHIPKNAPLTFYVATEENVFFITVPAEIVQKNKDFFWSNTELFKYTNDRIFIGDKMENGFVVLVGEYGIEKAVW